MKFLDQAKIYIASGKGGDGCVSFRREKYIEFGGPNGGNGGKGGNVIFVTDFNLNTLIDFRYQQHYKAKNGENGKSKNKTGAHGDNLIIKVPPGTEIYNEDKSVLLADLTKQDQKVVLATGGKGGLGNTHFKSSTNQSPRKFTNGEKIQEKWLWLSLKIFADVGIIGKPNAGKSTFLSKISEAESKIADYPFTTLHPVLGTIKKFDQEIILADIPGLIKNAHKGKGLGVRFLAHIERCTLLFHIVDCSENNFIENYLDVRSEIVKYGNAIDKKQELIGLNKSDLITNNKKEILDFFKKETGKNAFIFSSISNEGLEDLINVIFKICYTND